MPKFKYFTLKIVFFLILVFTHANAQNKIPDPIPFTIFHTNDIHTHLKAEPKNGEKNPYNLGGVAKLKTLVDNLRETNPNSLLLDGGDWSEGTAYYFADAGINILKIMSNIGYDAAVVGNHDFLNGPLEMTNTVHNANPSFAVLGANKDLMDPALDPVRAYINETIKDFVIVNKNGIRIALIGILCVDFTYKEYFKPAAITNPIKSIEELTEKIHRNNLADVIVLISHNTFSTNVKWAEKIPYVNIVISGHSHIKTPKPVTVINHASHRPAYIVETGEWGQFLGQMNLKYYPHLKLTALTSYQLNPVTNNLKENSEIQEMVYDQDTILKNKFGKNFFDKTVIETNHEFAHEEIKDSVLGTLAADAYREYGKTDVGLEINSLIGVSLAKGLQSPFHLFNIQPHIYNLATDKAWTIQIAKLKGWQLKLLVNAYLRVRSLTPSGWLSISGAEIIYSNKILAKSTSSSIQALPIHEFNIYNRVLNKYEPLDQEKTYTVAIHDGLALSLKLIRELTKLPVYLGNILDTKIQTWQAVSETAARNSVLEIEDHNPSGRYKTLEKDLSIHTHDIEFNPRSIQITIKNEGLKSSSKTDMLKIYRSQVNDSVNDQTENFENILIKKIFIPQIKPGESFKFEVNINRYDYPENGVYSNHFIIVDSKDGNRSNNETIRHANIDF